MTQVFNRYPLVTSLCVTILIHVCPCPRVAKSPNLGHGTPGSSSGPNTGLTSGPSAPGVPAQDPEQWGDGGGSDPDLAPSPSLPAPPKSACTSCPTSPPWMSSTSSPNTSAALRALRTRMVAAVPRLCGHARGASGGPASSNYKLAVWGLVYCETPVPVNKWLAP